MNTIIKYIVIGFGLTLISRLIDVFTYILGTPLLFILFFISAIGLVFIPLVVRNKLKKKKNKTSHITISSFALGFIFAILIMMPIISKWDMKLRKKAGVHLSIEIENYKTINGQYPNNLTELDTKTLKKQLPLTYRIRKFRYKNLETNYELKLYPGLFSTAIWNSEINDFNLLVD